MSPVTETVLSRVDAVRQRWWLFTLLTTTTLAMAVSVGLFILFMLADAVARLSRGPLIGLTAIWFVITAALLVLVGRRSLRGQRSMEATARRIEVEMPEIGSHLINLIQLCEAPASSQAGFFEAAVREAAVHADPVTFEDAARDKSRRHRLRTGMQTPRDLVEAVLVVLVCATAAWLCHRYVPGWDSAAGRLLTPWEFVPAQGKVEILEVSPGDDTEVMLGNSLEVAARIRNLAGEPHAAAILLQVEGQTETSSAMTADAANEHYRAVIPSIIKPLVYRLEIGDSQTRQFRVRVREKPTPTDILVVYHYPRYTGKADETKTQQQADLEAPQYTVAELRVRTSSPIAKGYALLGEQRCQGRVDEEGRLLVIGRLPMFSNGTFTIHLVNDAGHSDPSPRVNTIRVIPDRPPTVELLKPPREVAAALGDSVAMVVRATDDWGLEQLRLETKIAVAGSESPAGESPVAADAASVRVIQKWNDVAGATAATRQYRLDLKSDAIRIGQTMLVRAVARDRRGASGTGIDLPSEETATAWHGVKIISDEKRSASSLAQLENLRGTLWKLLERQLQVRSQAAGIMGKGQAAERAEAIESVRNGQVEIQKTAADLTQAKEPVAGDAPLTLKRVLGKLAFGEMLEAVRHCDAMVKQKEKAEDPKGLAIAELTAVQDRIIAALEKMLDVLRRAEGETLAEMKKRPGSDLPDDVKNRLEQARKKLDEFLKQQKKVIEATENLAKKAVEDYTDEDKQLLKKLATREDDWSKFMADLHSDLSKLPEQDFSNASMAKELVEIQTELKMAEDALTQKSVEIAVPLEQLGYERAEELKTNMEKWLPDTPDREKWSQEESPSDADKEAPMAELPGELEDLVGDLMEGEEDLFDEMEDISSSAADSIDKGAGWDAMDGPISNMSAKGVTGNRLPNTSEISGRSGEGRQGKASGEFVGDEAVGKGGRKTASRLTPDPYVKGQIKDHSKQSTGGATGGGKESGAGGEGLEGPQRRQPGPRDLPRLADRQATLRNKAEGIDLQFQVHNFHRTDLEKMIDLMSQVEQDLRAGRYQNALRQRRALAETLGNVKQYLGGEVEIRRDTTVNLPTEIQKEILGSMQDPSPQGWDEMNREYFERLSGKAEDGKGK